MFKSHIIGYPRIGAHRETKKAVEAYWAKEITQDQLMAKIADIKSDCWKAQQDAGLDWITVGDFSLYDHVLDMAAMLGVVPERYGRVHGSIDIDTIFRMARGRAPTGEDTIACEMTKWFDTNYHYIVPELEENQAFKLSTSQLFDDIKAAKQQGCAVKPTILGPISFLWLAKMKSGQDKFKLIDNLIPAYGEILNRIKEQGVEWVQIEEPILALDLSAQVQSLFDSVYRRLRIEGLKVLVATYFEGLKDNLNVACDLPVEGLHIDLVRDPEQLQGVLDRLSSNKVLSVGLIDGRNIWRANLRDKMTVLEQVIKYRRENVWVSSSCSLLHCPVDLENETKLPGHIKNWLAFAKQKLNEITVLTKGCQQGTSSIEMSLKESDAAARDRAQSEHIHKNDVKARVSGITSKETQRLADYSVRAKTQREQLKLPLFPTTTIGSFPQTSEIRVARRDFKAGKIDICDYETKMKQEIQDVVRFQEEVGLDVLVHGEPERNDMVEYFGELLDGFAFTQNGWVQSYGSRCVKPPVIYGDVARTRAMTTSWSEYAQSLTQKPMKGMLTGPVTILCWSFVRDDQPREQTAKQIALALRDEVSDLEMRGIRIIQIDEPAFREGLPLRKSDWQYYLKWAVNAFKLATAGAQNATQIHTHMCYCEFNDVIEWIAALDADVITIETSRSAMELLQAFESFKYPNEIGPGVYDIHSPRVPSVAEMENLLGKATQVIPASRLWVNPDCGLKTRGWEETREALSNMVNAARRVREKIGEKEAVLHQ